MDIELPPVFVASYRRSGTHLTLDSLAVNFPELGETFANFDSDAQDVHSCRLFKTHVHAQDAANSFESSSKFIHVVRDGRDVMVSLYY